MFVVAFKILTVVLLAVGLSVLLRKNWIGKFHKKIKKGEEYSKKMD
jgi:hypothetical protein